MDGCSLLALLSCLSLYVDTGIRYTDVEYAEVRLNGAERVYVAESRNPFGQVSLGVEARLSDRIVASLEASHDSSLRTNSDRGENIVRFNVRWYLFGRRQ